ncbi:MAG: LysR substrate-binding domain-containing protein [Acidovorax sp.]|uniref:LysR substrate-binding domain-containing protein n=1 Tax=Acidovorax sp. TaxID=1872122 RepID=UPI0026017726|nr:LysR substrate-binding domain-containing protein [Acidovorax sp.]MDH4418414.1 LysR substrate-binding domain-containing protein [Acidovorax sp.]
MQPHRQRASRLQRRVVRLPVRRAVLAPQSVLLMCHAVSLRASARRFVQQSQTSGNRLLMDLALANVPDRPQCLYEAKHVTTLLGLVEAGLGVAAVPSLAMPGKEHPTLVSIPLVEPIVTRQMGLIKRRGKSLSPAAQQLYDLLVATRSVRPRSAAMAQKIQSGQ